jgi:HKD family nuclease
MLTLPDPPALRSSLSAGPIPQQPRRRQAPRIGTLPSVPIEILPQPDGSSVGDRLISELTAGNWDEFRCAVAFAKLSGVQYLDGPLRAFTGSGRRAVVAVGIDHKGTSFEAASQLAAAVQSTGELVITTDVAMPPSTFHPKLYCFLAFDTAGDVAQALVVSGSSNLTEGGLFTNYEFSTAWIPALPDKHESAALNDALNVLDTWQDTSSGRCVLGDAAKLVELHQLGLLPSEVQIAAARAAAQATGSSGAPPGGSGAPSGLSKVPRPQRPSHTKTMGPPLIVIPLSAAPVSAQAPTAATGPTASTPQPALASAGATHNVLFLDVGNVGRKTEVYLSKTALNEDPQFFGPFTGRTTPKRATSDAQPERQPRPVVDMRLVDANGNVVSEYRDHALKIWQYAIGKSANQDVRITIPAELLRSLPAGCILEMRRNPVRAGTEYRLDFLTPGSGQWSAARAAATRWLPGRKRQVGWQ